MEPIHLAHGDAAAGALRRAIPGATVVVQRDLLTIGPCDLDPEIHRRLRMAHWGIEPGELVGIDDLLCNLRGPIVLWTSSAWSDSCHTWYVLDALERLGIERSRIQVVSVGSPDELAAAWQNAAPLDEGFFAEGVALWRAYASASPLAFDEAHHRGSPSFPELQRSAEGHSAFFPFWREGRIHLSEVDEALFAWINGAAIGRTLDPIMGWIGDASLYARIQAWRDAGAFEMEGDELRLSEAGRALRDHGAASVGELVPVWVGGCRVNDPARPWVRGKDGRIAALT